MKRVYIILIFFTFSVNCFSQQYEYLYQRGAAAYRRGDYVTTLENLFAYRCVETNMDEERKKWIDETIIYCEKCLVFIPLDVQEGDIITIEIGEEGVPPGIVFAGSTGGPPTSTNGTMIDWDLYNKIRNDIVEMPEDEKVDFLIEQVLQQEAIIESIDRVMKEQQAIINGYELSEEGPAF